MIERSSIKNYKKTMAMIKTVEKRYSQVMKSQMVQAILQIQVLRNNLSYTMGKDVSL